MSTTGPIAAIGNQRENPPIADLLRGCRVPVNAVMLAMRRTVAQGVKTCTGLSAPARMRPIAIRPRDAALIDRSPLSARK